MADIKAPMNNATLLTTGTLDGDRLPAISTTKKGGVPATGTPTNKYLRDDGSFSAIAESEVTNLTTDLAAKAPLASPTFTGTVTAPTINLTGGQIKFPATQAASTDVNTLDDYEEGTWTPSLAFGGVNIEDAVTPGTYTAQVGRYVKVGNLVSVSLRIVLSAKGSATGAATLTGIPFAGAWNLVFPAGLRILVVTFADVPMASLYLSTISLAEITNAGTTTNLTNTDFADTSQVLLDITYLV